MKSNKKRFSNPFQRRHCADLGELGPDLAHVLVDGKLIARVPESKCRMVSRHYMEPVLLYEEAPDVAHDGLLAEKRLVRGRTAKQDHLGLYQSELFCQEGLAGMDLLRRGTPVLRRTALGDVADVVILFRKAVAVDEVLKELAGSSDERQALKVLLLARSLADYHERRMTSAPVDNNVSAAGPESAVAAGTAFSLKLFPFCVKSVCHNVCPIVPSRVIRELYYML